MTDGFPPESERSRSGSVPAADSADADPALWRKLSEATTTEQLGHAWLGLQSRMIGGVSGGVVVLERPQMDSAQPAAVWPRNYQIGAQLSALLLRVTRERKGIVARGERNDRSEEQSELFLAFPVRVGRRVHGAAALEISARTQIELQAAMRQLQWGMAWLENWVLRHGQEAGSDTARRLSTVLEIAGFALEENRFLSSATAAVTELASRLECDRVSVGFLARKQVKVRALSHSAQFGKHMNLIRSIGMAMGESVDQQATLCYPETDSRGGFVLRAHEDLARVHGDGAVLTVPFVDAEGRAFGAMTFERAVAEEFDEATTELCAGAAAVLGPILEDKRLNDRLLVTRIGDSIWIQIRRLTGPAHAVRKLVAVAVLAVAVFFTFAKGQYRITADTTLEGEVQRAVAAPFDGFVLEAAVRGGDIVREGQVICNLDVRDLRLEYSRWSSEREQYLFEHRRAMAERDRAAMNVLSKKARQAEAQIALLDGQISRASIVAPFDGIVVSGDLSQSLGAPVEKGQVLFEVAPLDSYRVMLQVDERDISEVRVGQSGYLILTAMPREHLPFTITKVTPISRTEEGSNYFQAEGTLQGVSAKLRPGMQGFAKIETDRRRLIWIWTHRMIDWLRIKLWVWLP